MQIKHPLFTLSRSERVALRAPSGLPNGKQYLGKTNVGLEGGGSLRYPVVDNGCQGHWS